jgi:hypothetical protein
VSLALCRSDSEFADVSIEERPALMCALRIPVRATRERPREPVKLRLAVHTHLATSFRMYSCTTGNKPNFSSRLSFSHASSVDLLVVHYHRNSAQPPSMNESTTPFCSAVPTQGKKLGLSLSSAHQRRQRLGYALQLCGVFPVRRSIACFSLLIRRNRACM